MKKILFYLDGWFLHFGIANKLQNEFELFGIVDVAPKTEKFYVHCAGGYRSMIASSILKSRGFHNLVDIKGGYKAIEKTSVSRSEYICPSLI
mgnify:CR=1 FL=1